MSGERASRPPYDVIIPARDEAQTIADVISAAKASRATRVIVVDDHSSDDTAKIAKEAGAEVFTSQGNGSKALALATGVAASSASILVFFDADILGVRPEHFDLLAAPVAAGPHVICCGLVDYGKLRSSIFMRLPPITGLRAVRRNVFTAIPAEKLNGFQIEIMINEVAARAGMPTAIRVLAGTDHRSKVEKLGKIKGLRSHASMTLELLHCLTFVPLWTYGSYLRNLTVIKESNPEASS